MKRKKVVRMLKEMQKTVYNSDTVSYTHLQLKVGGIDRFSRLKEEDLEDMILSEMKETIEKGIHDPSSYNNVLKWMLRGLSLDDAIHKVNVDYEIASNCTYY